jgi:hypothetical protein
MRLRPARPGPESGRVELELNLEDDGSANRRLQPLGHLSGECFQQLAQLPESVAVLSLRIQKLRSRDRPAELNPALSSEEI